MLEELAALVGTDHVLTAPDSLESASRSWFPPHLKGRPTLCTVVVQPGSDSEVAALVHWAAANGKTLRAVGGGTGTQEQNTADIALDTSRLTALSWSEEDLTVTAGAGVTLGAIEEQLAGHGYTLGQAIGSANLATVGGCIASDARGLFSGKYGSFHDSVISQTRHGGIITQATLAMFPQPEARAWAVFDFAELSDAIDALRLIHRCDSRPALGRIVASHPLTPAQRGDNKEILVSPPPGGGRGVGGWGLMLAFEGDELVQTGHFQLAYAICQQVGGVPGDPDEGERWLETRERGDFWSANAHEGTFADLLRLPAAWSELKRTHATLVQQLDGRVLEYSLEIAHPTPHGALIEVAFTLQGDERRYRELRATILATQ